MCQYATTERTRLRFNSELGSYDQQLIAAIIDDAPHCHISTVIAGRPYIQSTIHWRRGKKLYMHGTVKNKMVQALANGAEAALAFTHFDGYILARSAFNHAVLYRSVVAFSKARVIDDPAEKNEALRLFIEHIQQGRWGDVRQPTTEELKMTGVLEFELEEVSAKCIPQDLVPALMPGGEFEAEADAAIDAWSGFIPYQLVRGEPVGGVPGEA